MLKIIRRLVQTCFFLFFLYLLARTAFPLESAIPVNLFQYLDPLITITSIAAGHVLLIAVIFSSIAILATLVCGRVFCGWACPFGTTLDIFSNLPFLKKFRKKHTALHYTNLKYLILLALVIFSFFGVTLAGVLDPISIAIRTYTVVLYPPAVLLGNYVMQHTSNVSALENLNYWLASNVLPTNTPQYACLWLFILFIMLILATESLTRRFWCRNLCPLGALFALVSRLQRFRFTISDNCISCSQCERICKMGAIKGSRIHSSECITCFTCSSTCKKEAVKFSFQKHAFAGKKPKTTNSQDIHLFHSRRGFIVTLALSLPAAVLARFIPQKKQILLPPCVSDRRSLISSCIRCGECVKVCPGNVLQPSLFENGVEGAFTPLFNPQYGYCLYECILCSSVCPTGAIPQLPLADKQHALIGFAVLNKDICLPYAKKKNCIVCEEMCPIPTKAIKLESTGEIGKDGIELKKPYVIADMCNGCGACEFNCPVRPKRAIRIYPMPE
ncbi:MAG: 4Fe-4S binding protein [Planctomycetota bacterium]